jgi:hypothetical protein
VLNWDIRALRVIFRAFFGSIQIRKKKREHEAGPVSCVQGVFESGLTLGRLGITDVNGGTTYYHAMTRSGD